MKISIFIVDSKKETDVVFLEDNSISRLFDLLKHLNLNKNEVSVVMNERLTVRNEKIKNNDIIKIFIIK